MSSATEARPVLDRLDPFAFPSDTTFRFFLLILSVLGASALIYLDIFSDGAPWGHLGPAIVNLQDCLGPTYPAKESGECIAQRVPLVMPWIFGSIVALFGIAGAIYWTYPSWKIRRARLVRLRIEDAPAVVAYLQDLSQEAGLSRPPILVWNPFNRAKTGLAFGRFRRRFIALSGGLMTQFYTDEPAFRAVMLHELAHLGNRDVDQTYLTLAMWWAFVIAALIPFALSSIRVPLEARYMIWRILALAILVYLTRSAVLRAREFYADVRASIWDGPGGALSSVLKRMPEPKTSPWRAVFQLHPRPAERLRVLGNLDLLFRVRFWDALAAGVVAAMAMPSIFSMLALFMGDAEGASWAASLLTITVAVCGVGILIWRAAFAAAARGEVLQGTVRLGLGLASGLLLGEFFSITDISGPVWSAEVVWGLPVYATIGCFVPWLALVASTWLEVAEGLRSPRKTYRLSLAAAGLVVCLWSGFIYMSLFGLRFYPLGEAIRDFYIVLLTSPLLVAAFFGLWAIPVSAYFGWRPAVSPAPPRWGFLDNASRPLTLPQSEPFHLDVALRTGAAGGLLFCAVMVVIRLGLRIGLPPGTGSSEAFRAAFMEGQRVLAAIMQAGVAVLVQRRVRRLPIPHGLLAAFIAACLIAGGGAIGLRILLPVPALPPPNLQLSPGQNPGQATIGFGFVLYTFVSIVNSGALLSLAVMIVASWSARARADWRSGVRSFRDTVAHVRRFLQA
jgi:Zn-dependent protease with chaperone function